MLMFVSIFASAQNKVKGTAEVKINVSSPVEVTFIESRPVRGVVAMHTDTVKVKGVQTIVRQVDLNAGVNAYYLQSHTSKKFHGVTLALSDGDRVVLNYTDKIEIDPISTAYDFQKAYVDLLGGLNKYKYSRVADFTVTPLSTDVGVMLKNFEAEAAELKKPFELLLAEGKISRQAYDFASMEVDYYTALSLSKIVVAGKDKNYTGYTELFKNLWKDYPVNGNTLRSMTAIAFAEFWLENHLEMTDPSFVRPQFENRMQSVQWMISQIEKDVTDPLALEALTASKLFYVGINNKTHERAIDEMIAIYDKKYPGNKFSPYLYRFIAENDNYERIIAKPFSEHVKFIENGDSIQTLQNVFARFKGQALFVDFWFSTCGPCCKEFAYASEMYEFLTKNNITPLFISIDGDNMNENWLNTIKLYDLEGHHIRVNKQTRKDMSDKYQINMFPRYMIVDKDGQIVEKAALRPSSGEELKNQIKEKLQ